MTMKLKRNEMIAIIVIVLILLATPYVFKLQYDVLQYFSTWGK